MSSDGWVPVCPLSSLASGELRLVETGKAEVVVANAGGEFYAVGAICTHALGYLDQGELDGYDLVCPLHDGHFDVRTGQVLSGPPEEPLCSYKVYVRDGVVHVQIPEE